MEERELRLRISLLSELPEANQQLLQTAEILKGMGLISDQAHAKIKANVQEEITERARLRIALEQEKQTTKQIADATAEVRAEIARTNLERQEAINRSKELTIEARKIAQETAQIRKEAGAFTNMLGSMKTQIIAAFGVHEIIRYGKEFVKITDEYLRAETVLKTVTKTQDAYNRSLAFIGTLADSTGQRLLGLEQQYSKFIAATEKANLASSERERIFRSLINAGSALQLSNEDIEGAIRAVTQMFSKGNIQAEELRGQLGERLPGAFSLTAEAMGVTEEQLNDLLKQGKVLAADVIPLLATKLEEIYGDKAQENLKTIGGSWNVVVNEIERLIAAMNENRTVSDFFVTINRGIADVFANVRQAVQSSDWGAFWGVLTGNQVSMQMMRTQRAAEAVKANTASGSQQNVAYFAAADYAEQLRVINSTFREINEIQTKIQKEEHLVGETKRSKDLRAQVTMLTDEMKQYKEIIKQKGKEEEKGHEKTKEQIEAEKAARKRAEQEKRKDAEESARKIIALYDQETKTFKSAKDKELSDAKFFFDKMADEVAKDVKNRVITVEEGEKRIEKIKKDKLEQFAAIEEKYKDLSVEFNDDLIESIKEVKKEKEKVIPIIEITGEAEEELYKKIKLRKELQEIMALGFIKDSSANIKAIEMFGVAVDKLTSEELDQLLDKLDEMQRKFKFWSDAIMSVGGSVYGVFKEAGRGVDETTEKTVSALTKMASGNVVGAITDVFTILAKGFIDTSSTVEAEAARQKKYIDDLTDYYKKLVEPFLNSAQLDSINDIYSSIIDPYGLSEIVYNYNLGAYDSATRLLDQEVKVGQQITDNYNLATKKEGDYYEQRLKNIEDVYNSEVNAINLKYDLIDQRANQRFDADTLAIKQNQSEQLLALITNEESKTSLMAEFASKRSQIIQTFALADQAITADTDQATIDAINAAIAARDKALTDLQNWYNDELEFVVNNEGQKRREYSVTEQIRKDAEDAINLLQLQYQADEIQRIKDRETELIAAEARKNTAIEEEQARHNQTLKDLGIAKDNALAESFQRLTDLVKANYDSMIAKAQEAWNQGLITLEQLNDFKNRLWEIKTISDSIVLPEGGFPDFYNPDFFNNLPRFNKGTEYVDREGKYPNGVDTVPAMVNKGERIIKTEDNIRLMAAGLSNQQVVDFALKYKANIDRPNLNFTRPNYDLSFVKTQTMNNKEVIKAIGKLETALEKQQKVLVSVQNGRTTVQEMRDRRITKRINDYKS